MKYLILMIFLLLSCVKRDYDFEYVKLQFNDGTDTTFVDCAGGIENKSVWKIITKVDGNVNVYPLSAIKTFTWKYTQDDLKKQVNEISF